MKKGLSDVLENENTIIRRLYDLYKWRIVPTPELALVDGIAYREDKITHIVEIKSRFISWRKLMNYGSYLISHKKLEAGQMMSRMMRVPFIVVVHLVQDDMIIAFEVTNKHGLWCFDYDVKDTVTPMNIDGGRISRRNAFLPIEHSVVL
jgi:desulfoferrodoxin (superoxide reductase-like protein)